jgi:hypothetical protein
MAESVHISHSVPFKPLAHLEIHPDRYDIRR